VSSLVRSTEIAIMAAHLASAPAPRHQPDPIKRQALHVIDRIGLSPGSKDSRLAVAFIEGMSNSRSAQIYAYHLAAWLSHCVSRGIRPLGATRLEATAYLGQIGHLADSTQKVRCAVITAFYELALENEMVRRNPFRKLRPKTVDDEDRRRTPSIDEAGFDSVLGLISRGIETGDPARDAIMLAWRDFTMLYLMGRIGLRAFQIEALTWAARTVGDEGVRLTIVRKGGGRRTFDLLTDLADALEGWATVVARALGRPLRPDDAIFAAFRFGVRGTLEVARDSALPPLGRRGISATCKARLKDAGFEGYRYAAHLFRATAASIAYARGAGLEDCRLLLDHKSAQTTRVYLPPQKDRLAAASRWLPTTVIPSTAKHWRGRGASEVTPAVGVSP
jgi:integrase